jgi:hypothetical protein
MKKNSLSLLLPLIFLSTLSVFGQTSKYTISGYVKEKGSKELLVGVPVFITS